MDSMNTGGELLKTPPTPLIRLVADHPLVPHAEQASEHTSADTRGAEVVTRW
jgi:hypothetical protein